MLIQFADEFENLYGRQNVRMNIHLLRHIADEVRYSGPLWAQSLFGFEASNGRLVKSVNGCNNVLAQITQKYLLANTLAQENEANVGFKLHRQVNIEPSNEDKMEMMKFDVSLDETMFWTAVTFNGDQYKSILPKESKAIDYFIEFSTEKIGRIKYFAEFEHRIYAMLETYIIQKTTDHLKEVIVTGSNAFIPTHEIEEKLIYMIISSRVIVCRIPNKYEKT